MHFPIHLVYCGLASILVLILRLIYNSIFKFTQAFVNNLIEFI